MDVFLCRTKAGQGNAFTDQDFQVQSTQKRPKSSSVGLVGVEWGRKGARREMAEAEYQGREN